MLEFKDGPLAVGTYARLVSFFQTVLRIFISNRDLDVLNIERATIFPNLASASHNSLYSIRHGRAQVNSRLLALVQSGRGQLDGKRARVQCQQRRQTGNMD